MTEVRAVGTLGESLATPAGAVIPVEGVTSPALSTGENPVLLGQATAALGRCNLLEGVVVVMDSVDVSWQGLARRSRCCVVGFRASGGVVVEWFVSSCLELSSSGGSCR